MARKMPIAIDLAVPVVKADSGPSPVGSKATPGLVTVMGFGKDDVLFRSDQARVVQWRDGDGEIMALLVRLRPNVWGFSRSGDDDWNEVLEIYGNPDC